ncbi:MAG: hypothetical protein FWE53_03325 [Firmicutes bacterium]|nr:hypothetical protein [Bacillota bacterium]
MTKSRRSVAITVLACPLIVMMAAFTAPLYSEAVFLLISHANQGVADNPFAAVGSNVTLLFGLTAIIIAVLMTVVLAVAIWYYITGSNKSKIALFVCVGALVAAVVASIIANSVVMNMGAVLDFTVLTYYSSLIQNFLTLTSFACLNVLFVLVWNWQEKQEQAAAKSSLNN